LVAFVAMVKLSTHEIQTLRERAERETEWVVRERAELVRTSLRTIELWRDEDGGRAGVREPRRPLPGGDVDAIALDSDEPDD